MGKSEEKYYLVNADILPEAILKTIEAKELLASGKAGTVHEAVERVGLSRSAFYKYKDGIFPFNTMLKERIVTVSLDLEHRSGILSKVLSTIAQIDGNVLTINQTIPLQGLANVVLSIDTAQMQGELTVLLDTLRQMEGVRKAAVIGQGAS
jgi:chorismate mutase